jgi:Tfp pilus assembly protein PilW
VSDERGFSVLELAVASALLLAVLVPVLSALDSGVRTQAHQQARSDALDEVRWVVQRLSKEVRQAVWIDPSSTGSRLVMRTITAGSVHDVAYEVDGGTLARSVDAGTPVVVTAGVVVAGSGFVYEPAIGGDSAPTLIRLSLSIRPRAPGSEPVTLETDVHLRNSGAT